MYDDLTKCPYEYLFINKKDLKDCALWINKHIPFEPKIEIKKVSKESLINQLDNVFENVLSPEDQLPEVVIKVIKYIEKGTNKYGKWSVSGT